MKTVCRDRGERAVTLAEDLVRAMGAPPKSPADWEHAVDAAVTWVNDHGTGTETATARRAVLPIVAKRSHISYWDFDDD